LKDRARYAARVNASRRGRRRIRSAGVVAIACAMGVALPALRAAAQAGADDVEPIHLDFHVAAGCPDAGDFTARVHSHTAKFRIAANGEPARTLVIDVTLGPKGADGRLSFRDVSGASGVRALKGETCSEVLAGLALMAALAIDPAATIAPSESASSSTSASSSAPIASSAPASSLAAPLTSGSAPSPSVVPASTLRVSIGVAAETVFGLSPKPLYGGNLFFELFLDRASILSPSTRLALHADAGPSVTSDAGVARFVRYVATLDVCPIALPARVPSSTIGPTFAVRPCAQFGAGFVQASGSDIVDARTARERWLFAALLARGLWSPHPMLRVELAIGAALPFQRYRFRFEPSTSLYETATIAGFAELGAAISF
jgi:hypothetical protein